MSNTDSSAFLQTFARDALSRASNLSGRIGSFNPAPSNIDFSYTLNKPSTVMPPAIGDMLDDDKKNENAGFINEQVDALVSKYFPNLTSAFASQPEAWAIGILSGNSPFGASRNVFDTAWHEGRDRAYRTAETEKAQILSESTLRGFTLPNGATVSAMQSAEVRASEAIAEINRVQVEKDSEIKLELIKFASSTAAQIKSSMMQTLSGFYGQWGDVLRSSHESSKVRTQAYAALTSALSSYYNVELGFEELRLKAAQSKSGAQEAKAKIGAQEGQVKTAQYASLASATKAFADAAGSAANAQGSLQAELYSGQL